VGFRYGSLGRSFCRPGQALFPQVAVAVWKLTVIKESTMDERNQIFSGCLFEGGYFCPAIPVKKLL